MTRARGLLGLGVLAAVGCGSDPAVLRVDLVEPATASAQFFHGNCFAGWSVGVDVRITETKSVHVRIESFRYRLVDQGSGVEISAETLDAATLDVRYGEGASVLPGGSSRLYRIGGVTGSPPSGPLGVEGEIVGRDENDHRVVAPLQLTTTIRVGDDTPPESGACDPS